MITRPRRKIIIGIMGVLVATALIWTLRPPNKSDKTTRKIGIFLFAQQPVIAEIDRGFRQEMDRLSTEKHLKVEYVVRSADGDPVQAAQVATFFRTTDVDLVFAVGLPAAQALKTAGVDKPVIFGGPPDPIGAGLVPSLKNHKTNFTGTRYLPRVGVMLDVLRSVLPDIKTVAVLHNTAEANSAAVVKLLDLEASSRKLEVRHFPIGSAPEIDAALRSLGTAEVQALFLPTDNLVYSNLDRILARTQQLSLPAFNCTKMSVEKGALFSIATDYTRIGALSAEIAARVAFDGVDPATIDVLDVSEGHLYIRSDNALSSRFTAVANFPIERVK